MPSLPLKSLGVYQNCTLALRGRQCCWLMSCGGLDGGFLQRKFVIFANVLQAVVGRIGHDDVDISRTANSGKIKDANLAMVDPEGSLSGFV